MSDVLGKIKEAVLVRVAEQKHVNPLDWAQAVSSPQPRDFISGLRAQGVHIISEIKLASPSEGDLRPGADPSAIAADFLANGAYALSILTEQDFFKGSPEYLLKVRKRFPDARLLMKDFVVDEYQCLRARADGADAILLIVALLGSSMTKDFLRITDRLGLTALVEVHNVDELEIAIDAGAKLIGVNNRNLKTLQVSLKTSEDLMAAARTQAARAVMICESGLTSGADLKRMRAIGYHGFLIGSTLMKADLPGLALRSLLESAR